MTIWTPFRDVSTKIGRHKGGGGPKVAKLPTLYVPGDPPTGGAVRSEDSDLAYCPKQSDGHIM